MGFLSKANNAYSKIATVGGINNSDDPVTFSVITGEGSRFPASNFLITIDNEILLCTSRTGDSFTCVRQQESTTIAAHTQNADVELRVTKGTLLEYETLSKMQGMAYAADGESSDSYAVTLTPAPTAYFAGMVVNFKANTANTGAATLNVNSLGAKTIKKLYNQDLDDNDILSGQLVSLIYDGTNFQMISPISNVVQANSDGWIDANESWSYASSTTITVPSGAASKYKIGDKIKLTQTTVKYFYVVGVADTVLTVSGGSDYSVANAAISDNYYSHLSDPLNFPVWFNYPAGGSGYTVGNGTLVQKFAIVGGVLFTKFNFKFGSSSSISAVRIGLPFSVANETSNVGSAWYFDSSATTVVIGSAYNDSASQYTPLVANNNYGILGSATPFTWATNDELHAEIAVQLF